MKNNFIYQVITDPSEITYDMYRSFIKLSFREKGTMIDSLNMILEDAKINSFYYRKRAVKFGYYKNKRRLVVIVLVKERETKQIVGWTLLFEKLNLKGDVYKSRIISGNVYVKASFRRIGLGTNLIKKSLTSCKDKKKVVRFFSHDKQSRSFLCRNVLPKSNFNIEYGDFVSYDFTKS